MAGERWYLAYLVRLWAVRDDGDPVWRASAEDAHTGERRAFADLASLCSFLQKSARRLADGDVGEGIATEEGRGLLE